MMTGEVTRSAANYALLNYRQADNEGIMVKVSRQAIHMVDDEIKQLRACFAALEAEIADLRAKLAAFEGQLTAEEMRERCAQWHEDRARIAMSTHHGDKEHAILAAHCRADWHENVADELRSLPTKREEG